MNQSHEPLDDDGVPRGSREKDGPRIQTSSGWHQHWWVTHNGIRTHWVEIVPTAGGHSHWEKPQGD